MIAKHIVERQLQEIGAMYRFLGRPELKELPNILFEGEMLRHLTFGRYEGGWATLCATDRRVLLVDKKPFYLTIEDIRYDMVSDVQYNHRLVNASLKIGTVHKTISFIGYNHDKLRALTNYIQEQVMHVRAQPGQATEPASAGTPAHPVAVYPRQQDQTTPPMAEVLSNLQTPPQQPINPYRAPVMVQRRVSRFY